MRATVDSLRGVTLATVEVQVPEWDATVLLRALTRAQVRVCRDRATTEDGIDGDILDLSILACALADPDLIGEVGLDEAIALLQAQPVELAQRLVREALAVSGLVPAAPFRSGTEDDAG